MDRDRDRLIGYNLFALTSLSRARIRKVSGYRHMTVRPGTEVIQLFSCSTQLSTKFVLLINVKMPTIASILTFMSGKNSILGLSEHKKI